MLRGQGAPLQSAHSLSRQRLSDARLSAACCSRRRNEPACRNSTAPCVQPWYPSITLAGRPFTWLIVSSGEAPEVAHLGLGGNTPDRTFASDW